MEVINIFSITTGFMKINTLYIKINLTRFNETEKNLAANF